LAFEIHDLARALHVAQRPVVGQGLPRLQHPLLDLRALVPTIRHLGEKGMKITRFKGLGEMDAEQLWETTMDPSKRTLLQVRLDDAASANDLFTTLMGEDVESRRNFIQQNAKDVRFLDI